MKQRTETESGPESGGGNPLASCGERRTGAGGHRALGMANLGQEQ